MKNIMMIGVCTIFLFSCIKEKDISNENFTVTASTEIWSTTKLKGATNIDSTKFYFYTTSALTTPFSTLYTNQNGQCSITLKGNQDYYYKCISASYKNALGTTYYYEQTGEFHSTHEQKPNKFIPGNFTATFVIYQKGKGSTNQVYNDPINY
jgi:hypothetical protein